MNDPARPTPTALPRAAALLIAVTVASGCSSGPGGRTATQRDQRTGTDADPAAATRPATRTATPGAGETTSGAASALQPLPEETHLANLRMLTNGGENAEAYWSWDGSNLIFQARRGEEGCDRIRMMRPDGSDDRLIADAGAHTCAFFLPGDERIVFSSTRSAGPDCPPKPDYSQGYVWPLWPSHEIYSARRDGADLVNLTNSPGYDAEATVAPDGRIVFTSTRDGDLDIYTMRSDGTDVRRLTTTPGYDGGPFFSPSGRLIAFRAHHPTDSEELADYRRLLAEGLVRPGHLDLWVMNADGSGLRKITDLPGANFAPSFLPDESGLIFSSNHHDPQGRNFDLYVISLDGRRLERITHHPDFDGFPMFSPDGRRLVFCSNRNNAERGETNVFIADWKP